MLLPPFYPIFSGGSHDEDDGEKNTSLPIQFTRKIYNNSSCSSLLVRCLWQNDSCYESDNDWLTRLSTPPLYTASVLKLQMKKMVNTTTIALIIEMSPEAESPWRSFSTEPMGKHLNENVPAPCVIEPHVISLLETYGPDLQSEDSSHSLQGVVNDHFHEIHMESIENPNKVVQMIEAYFSDVGMILAELNNHVDSTDIHFASLTCLAREVEEKSASIGAEDVKRACADLIQACDLNQERNFSRALMWLSIEFSRSKSKLEAYLQMERRIMRVLNLQR